MDLTNKKEKIIRVDNLVIHANNVEIVDAENVEIKRAKNIKHEDHHREEEMNRRHPWDSFWGWPPPKRPIQEPHELHEHHEEIENIEVSHRSELDYEH